MTPSSPQPLPATPGSHAIVIGGSIAGMCAARTLLNHFDRVTLIERDEFPATPEFRKGVPQARHPHLLLVRGQREMERLFPGLDAELAARGAPLVDWTADAKLHGVHRQGWGPHHPSGLFTRTCSRTLLEWTIRRHLLADQRVQALVRHEVIGLTTDASGRVTGVQLRQRGEATGPAQLSADLVVDASGRSSHAPQWLNALGYPAPEETIVNGFLGYASRWYRRPSQHNGDWKAMAIFNRPPHNPRGGMIYPIEDDCWIVSLNGIARHYPPTDEAGFLDFARQLPHRALYDAIKDAEPLSPIYAYQRTENRMLHYERMPRWPERFVVLGDAVAAFNPTYGQGMTVGVIGTQLLDQSLRKWRNNPGMAHQFQRLLARSYILPWIAATGEDLRWEATVGQRPPQMMRMAQSLFDAILNLAQDDIAVNQVFFEVMHMLRPPTAFLTPKIVGQVLAYNAKQTALRWSVRRRLHQV